MIVGETYLHYHQLRAYFGQNQHEGIHLLFNFLLVMEEWKASELASAIAEYDMSIPAGEWPNWVHGNHDMPRITETWERTSQDSGDPPFYFAWNSYHVLWGGIRHAKCFHS